MSVLQKLTEGVQHRDMQAEGQALLNKWEATGLLEGLNQGQAKQGMAVLLENQAKELLREASSMAAGDVEGFAAVAFPIVRRVFGGLIANDLISVQPMSLPSGLIFFLDFTHEGARAGFDAGTSLYGGGRVGRNIVEGVDDAKLSDSGFYGLRSGYANAFASDAQSPSSAARVPNPETSKDLDYDPDLKGQEIINCAFAVAADLKQMDPGAARAVTIAATGHTAVIADAEAAALHIDTNGDLLFSGKANNDNDDLLGVNTNDNTVTVARLRPVRRLTEISHSTSAEGLKEVQSISRLVLQLVSVKHTAQDGSDDALPTNAAAAKAIEDASDAVLVAQSSGLTDEVAIMVAASTLNLEFPVRDDIDVSSSAMGALQAGPMPLEEPKPDPAGNSSSAARTGKNTIAEIDIKVDSLAVTAQTKKLKAKWSPELGQDLNAYHNLDAEVELTGILSEQIALEIDRELLGELVDGAKAATRYWSRAPGLFVDADGTELGARSAAPDFTGTVSEWYETLIETINDVSAQIHRKTLRGGANFVVCSPEVANILEFTSGFRASVTADQDRGTIGAVKAGSLSKKFDVYVDPYFLRNVILVGRKGSSFLESGYVYAPYVPLQVTPTIFGTEDFVPRKGVMTRYAKKMVRPDMYGLVIVRGLLGESGS